MMRYQRSSSYQNVMRSNRYKPILVILLVLLAAFLILRFTGVGGLDSASFETQRNAPRGIVPVTPYILLSSCVRKQNCLLTTHDISARFIHPS